MAQTETVAQAGEASQGSSGLFDCNICLETARNPVITVCGHLYCWPCIYKWLRTSAECPLCPVCKAGLVEESLIPLYGRGRPQIDPRKEDLAATGVSPVPARPAAQRPSPVAQQQALALQSTAYQRPAAAAAADDDTVLGWDFPPGVGSLHGSGALPRALSGADGATVQPGLIPSLFGLQFIFPPHRDGVSPTSAGREVVASQPLSPEQAQQAWLSRLLLLLGSFVILCLLLF